MHWIPAAKNAKWWAVSGISTIVLAAALWLIRFGYIGQVITSEHAVSMLLFAAAASFAFGIAGWLGARWIWGLSTLGMAIGLIAMAAYGKGNTGWEDLASFAAFLMFSVFGIGAGLVAEVIAAFVRLVKNKRG